MMSLFDDEQIMETYAKDMAREAGKEAAKEAERKTAERLIKKGKMSLEEIAECVLTLSLDELKELEAEVMNLA